MPLEVVTVRTGVTHPRLGGMTSVSDESRVPGAMFSNLQNTRHTAGGAIVVRLGESAMAGAAALGFAIDGFWDGGDAGAKDEGA